MNAEETLYTNEELAAYLEKEARYLSIPEQRRISQKTNRMMLEAARRLRK